MNNENNAQITAADVAKIVAEQIAAQTQKATQEREKDTQETDLIALAEKREKEIADKKFQEDELANSISFLAGKDKFIQENSELFGGTDAIASLNSVITAVSDNSASRVEIAKINRNAFSEKFIADNRNRELLLSDSDKSAFDEFATLPKSARLEKATNFWRIVETAAANFQKEKTLAALKNAAANGTSQNSEMPKYIAEQFANAKQKDIFYK